ncbi:hypothetical protein A9F13_05g00473 [Clavispora lusitaniae]|uniref:HTH CENPB-type domain-containing protein n=1 Tax=Clavispora lusitaniae TaxID=36911 RepID=A0AA91Q183_CLALS|nr:hypothetical protein A9F13_05g00473 [Clavispora lusitaniae]
MGYNIKQKIEICLKSEANPLMTQTDLANWAMKEYGSSKPPSQTTISRILSSKNEIIGSKESDFSLVRRRKQTNPVLRKILTEWITQTHWEQIPITTPIIQSTANAIWTRLPKQLIDGNGVFNHKWCNHFVKRLNINLVGSRQAVENNLGYPLNKVWMLDEKLELKKYIEGLIARHNYSPKDIFTIDEISLFHALPLDQIFDISSIDKGLKQSQSSTKNMLTVMLGCNIDGSEKLMPLIVSKEEELDVSESSHPAFKSHGTSQLSPQALINKICEVYHISLKTNINKWITSSMFQDYLLTLDHKIENASPDRQILIFLDNSSSHRMINLEFKHIRLVYMENASKHKNPYNGSFNGVKFDYLPMSFGIVEEFKILYRLQQYLEMINKQRNQSESDDARSPISSTSNLSSLKTASESAVLSESDYNVPFIKVIEWIKRSWDSISAQKIFSSWSHTYLINFKAPWPATDRHVVAKAQELFRPFIEAEAHYDSQKSYHKLREIMKYLNVMIPWNVDELLGLVNERSKVSLDYVSIEEIIGSCVSEKDLQEQKEQRQDSIAPMTDPWFTGVGHPLPQPHDARFSQPSLSPPKLNNIPQKLSLNPPQLAPISPALQYSNMHRASPQPHPLRQPNLQSKYREPPYSDYSIGSPGSTSMNALLLATSVSKNQEINNGAYPSGNSFSALMPIKQENLPPVLTRMDMNNSMVSEGKRGGNFDLNGFPERKRQALPTSLGTPYFSGSPMPGNSATQDSLTDPINFVGPSLSPMPHHSMVNGFRPSASERPSGGNSDYDAQVGGDGNDRDLISLLNRVIDASGTEGLKLSNFALEELRSNLTKMQHKYDPDKPSPM